MANIYFIQLIGVLLAVAGIIALTASAYLYGAPLTQSEKRRTGNLDRRGNVYRLPFNLEIVASTVFLLAGAGILTWAKFDHCTFLAHWLPDLPEAIRLLLSCR